MPVEPTMTSLESVLWYLTLPLLIAMSWAFIRVNLRQYERLNPPAAEETPPGEGA